MNITALHGAAGAGKDTFADRLVERHGFVKRGFADPLYEEVARAWRVDVEWLKDRARKEVPQSELRLVLCFDRGFHRWAQAQRHDELQKRSPRWVLEQWGTGYRRSQCETYWLDQMASFIAEAKAQDVPGVVIPDCRFPNEAEWVRANGGRIVEIVRPGLAAVTSHVSARRLPDTLIDEQAVNAGAISCLHDVADSLICSALTNHKPHGQTGDGTRGRARAIW